jgi:hypothetical protein
MYDPSRHETMHHLERDRQRAVARATQRRSAHPAALEGRHPSVALAHVLRRAADRLDCPQADLAGPETVR